MNKKGFTIIELMIAVALAGIIAAIALPRIVDIQARQKFCPMGYTAEQISQAAMRCETYKPDILFSKLQELYPEVKVNPVSNVPTGNYTIR